jgi:hypothetical protein
MKVIMQNVQGAYVTVHEARAFNGEGTPSYSISCIFDWDHPAVKLIEEAQDKVGREKWGEKWETIKKELKAKDRLALHDGDTKASSTGFAGKAFVNARNRVRPRVVDRDNTELTIADGKPYSGCYVNVSVELWAQDNTYGKRINASLRGVQFLADGTPFSGGAAANEDEFAPVSDADALAAVGL